MKKQLRIFLTGAVVVVPFAITVWVIWLVGSGLDGLVKAPLEGWGVRLYPGVGALSVIAAIYLVGVLMHFWAFRRLLTWAERLVMRVPVVKTIYEAVRDLIKLFGAESSKMGRVVQYSPSGSDMVLLGVLTNQSPPGFAPQGPQKKVAVYLPYSYMFGGITVYVSPEQLRPVDMPVERALKLAAIAQVSSELLGRKTDSSDKQTDAAQPGS
ncbi:MAG: DUF502 domain-containing protein [Phycisphaerae bacterium]|nr:DUF502 domain-containing protein [Phycisphaerae bacterium]